MKNPGIDSSTRTVGWFTLCAAAVFLLYALANLRSRLYYHGPNYSFLFWMFAYCLLSGIGLLKRRKWAVLLLFLPGILCVGIFIYAWMKGERGRMPWELVNYAFLATLLGIPAALLRNWRALRW